MLLCLLRQGFRLCGGDKGAMETDEVCGRPLDPFAAHTPVYWFVLLLGGTKGTLTNWSNNKNLLCRSAPKVSKGRSESPLVASAEAKTLHKHAKTVCRCHQLNRAKGSREELPCGVQRQSLWLRQMLHHPQAHPAVVVRTLPLFHNRLVRRDA